MHDTSYIQFVIHQRISLSLPSSVDFSKANKTKQKNPNIFPLVVWEVDNTNFLRSDKSSEAIMMIVKKKRCQLHKQFNIDGNCKTLFACTKTHKLRLKNYVMEIKKKINRF